MASERPDAALKKGAASCWSSPSSRTEPGTATRSQQIAARADGAVSFHAASLYPILYRLEGRGLIAGRWVEKAGQQRRRYYRLTPEGRRVLAERRKSWSTFMQAVKQAAGLDYA